MARPPWSLVIVLAAAAAGTLGPLADGRTGAAVYPSIYVDYDDDCSFTIHADGGFKLTSATPPGTTIPPGTYQVVLRVPQDAPSCPLVFQLQGPGVQLEWDFGGEALGAQATETLQPGSTYVAADLRNPTRYRAVFSTAATGSSSSLVAPRPSTASGKGQQSSDAVGSTLVPYRGVLNLRLGVSGALRLEAKGKAVGKLKAGRYELVLVDESPRGALGVRKPKGSAVALTGAAFVGKKTTRIALTRGVWRFSSTNGSALPVVVVSP
jgi:hypothetical protein